MKNKLLLFASSILLAAGADAALIAAFDFQTTTTGGTAAVASATGTPSPLVYNANFGTATLYLNGTSGSSTFTTGVTNPEVTAFGGSNLNTGLDTDPPSALSTTTSGAASLTIANSSANAKRLVFAFSMTDLENLSISYTTQSTATGFNLQAWSYSTDGLVFTPFDTFSAGGTGTGAGGTNASSSFATVGVVTLDTLTALDGVATAYIGLTLSGASATAGNNRFDNIQFNSVPEPASALLGGMGLLCLLRRRR